MKRLILLFLLFSSYSFFVYSENDGQRSLKILGIGNSFTDDGMTYLPNLLESAGIKEVVLGRLIVGGCSLERHAKSLKEHLSPYHYEKSTENKWYRVADKFSFREAVADDEWDIIVLQQASSFSGMYDTYQPYLNELIEELNRTKRNENLAIAWQWTWSYSSESDHDGFVAYGKNQQQMDNAIKDAVFQMMDDTGIALIIPSGLTVRNLRESSLNNPPLDMTRDGYHMDLGAGRYSLACTWFTTLIEPVFRIGIVGNSFRTEKGNVPVTDESVVICWEAAMEACKEFAEMRELNAAKQGKKRRNKAKKK